MIGRMKTLALVGMSIATLSTAGMFATQAVAQDWGNSRDKDQTTPKEMETAKIGEAAPDFTLTDLDGKTHKLSDYKGKIIILEWFNPECPFVVHQYNEGPIKSMGKELAKDDGYVWLAINSGAPGMQGAGKEKNQNYHKQWDIPYPILLDEDGKVGRMYEAKTSPHMYVINADGVLVYHGAIDNAPMGRVRGDGEKVNYVQRAIDALKAGETISPDTTRPYGCSVKYARK